MTTFRALLLLKFCWLLSYVIGTKNPNFKKRKRGGFVRYVLYELLFFLFNPHFPADEDIIPVGRIKGKSFYIGT